MAGRIRLNVVENAKPPVKKEFVASAQGATPRVHIVKRDPAPTEELPAYLNAFLHAGSNGPKSAVVVSTAPVRVISHGTPHLTMAQAAKSQVEAIKAEAASQTDRQKTQAASSQTSAVDAVASSAARAAEEQSKDIVPQKFVTRAEVEAMIEEKLSSKLTSESREGETSSSESSGKKATKDEASNFRHLAICDSCDYHVVGARYKCLDCPDFDSCSACWQDVRKNHSSHRFVKITDSSLFPALSAKSLPVHKGVLCDGPLCIAKRTAIVGDRYKCAVCSDFDLCAGCEVYPGNEHNNTHPMIKMKSPIRKVSVTVEQELPAPAYVLPDDPLQQSTEKSQHSEQGQSDATADIVTPSTELREALAGIGAKVRKAVNKKRDSATRPVKHLTVACDSCDTMVCGSRYMCATCADFDLCEKCYKTADHDSDHVFVRYRHFVNNVVTPRKRIQATKPSAVAGQHKGFYCDECECSPILGDRFRCLVCNDYDACEKCKDVHDETHAMQIIPSLKSIARNPEEAKKTGEPVHDLFFGGLDHKNVFQDIAPLWQETMRHHQTTIAEQRAELQEVLEQSKAVVRKSMSDAKAVASAAWRRASQPPALVPAHKTVAEEPVGSGSVVAETEKAVKPAEVNEVLFEAAKEDLDSLSADFVEDISIPDGTTVTAGANFVKQWLLKNDGPLAWPAGVQAVYVGGYDSRAVPNESSQELQGTALEAAVQPGQSVVISLILQAPASAQNNVISYFKLSTPSGHRFGCKLWADVDVKSAECAGSSAKREDVDSTTMRAAGVDDVRPTSSAGSGEASTHSDMIFPSASTELPPQGAPSSDSASIAGTQHEEAWNSADEVTLSDDEDYEVLDEQSFSD